MESTYGDRERPVAEGPGRRRLLAEEIRAAHAAGGPLLIPAFAVERSQELLVDLLALMASGEVPEADIFLDSPLAIEACDVFRERGWNATRGENPFLPLRSSGRLRFVDDPADSDRLEQVRGWHVLLAASGMCDAGRVRKHLKRLLWRKETTVLLCGFQAGGTLGRLLADGASRVTIQGDEIRVRARVRRLDVYSAHADGPALARWVAARAPVSGSVFLVHGEPEGAEGLSRRLVEAGLSPEKIRIPDLDEGFDLSPADAIAVEGARARLAPHSASRPDWHNDRAAFQIALGAALEAAPDDEARKALLARLDRALEGA